MPISRPRIRKRGRCKISGSRWSFARRRRHETPSHRKTGPRYQAALEPPRPPNRLAVHDARFRGQTGVPALERAVLEALGVFESLVFKSDGISPRKNVPELLLTNLATALLLSGDARGCLQILSDLKNSDYVPVARLQLAIDRWWRSLSLWQRLRFCLGRTPRRPVELDFPPGAVGGPLGVAWPPRAAKPLRSVISGEAIVGTPPIRSGRSDNGPDEGNYDLAIGGAHMSIDAKADLMADL